MVFAIGLLIGMMTLVISEALLRVYGPMMRRDTWRMTAIGAGLRAVWVLLAMIWFVSPSAPDHAPAVFGLMTGYLASQVIEGLRYQKFFDEVK